MKTLTRLITTSCWKKDEKAENEKRPKAGYPAVHVIGCAQKPYYDSKRKILHWAKELKFSEEEE